VRLLFFRVLGLDFLAKGGIVLRRCFIFSATWNIFHGKGQYGVAPLLFFRATWNILHGKGQYGVAPLSFFRALWLRFHSERAVECAPKRLLCNTHRQRELRCWIDVGRAQ